MNRYRIYCKTDEKFEFVDSETTPTECPANSGHEIDSDGIVIIKEFKCCFRGALTTIERDALEYNVIGDTCFDLTLDQFQVYNKSGVWVGLSN